MKYVMAENMPNDIPDQDGHTIQLTIDGITVEEIFAINVNAENQMLVNHAVAFHPFPSWGMILPVGNSIEVKDYQQKLTIPLHPEAYADYVAEEIIDEDGKIIMPEPQEPS